MCSLRFLAFATRRSPSFLTVSSRSRWPDTVSVTEREFCSVQLWYERARVVLIWDEGTSYGGWWECLLQVSLSHTCFKREMKMVLVESFSRSAEPAPHPSASVTQTITSTWYCHFTFKLLFWPTFGTFSNDSDILPIIPKPQWLLYMSSCLIPPLGWTINMVIL